LNANELSYFGVSGGDLRLTCREASLIIRSDLHAPVLKGSSICLEGTVYSASLLEPSLLRSLRVPLIEHGDGLCRLAATVVKNLAPSKVYGALTLSAASFDVLVKEETAELLGSVASTVSDNFSHGAANDPFTPPLQVWDNLNYWLHGNFRFLADRISTSIIVHLGKSELLKFDLVAEKMDFKCTKIIMDFSGSKFSIDASLIKQDENSALSGASRGYSVEAEGLPVSEVAAVIVEDTSGFANPTNRRNSITSNQMPADVHEVASSRIFFMPTLSMVHRFTFVGGKLNDDLFYGHHHVYLRPEPEGADRFLRFRSRRHTVHYELKVVCSEEKSEVLFLQFFMLIIDYSIF
jgi:hypothetical protein